MGKEQIRVLWSSGTWKRMCIWADHDHDSHWRGCNAKGGWLTIPGPLIAYNIHSFLRFPWPSPSPMPSGIWKHVTRRKKRSVYDTVGLQSGGNIWKAHGRITLSVLQQTPSPNFAPSHRPFICSPAGLPCQKLIPHTGALEESSCSACI